MRTLKTILCWLSFHWFGICLRCEAFEHGYTEWCDGCNRWTDPTTCHCGDYEKSHYIGYGPGHSFVPMGCACGYAKR